MIYALITVYEPQNSIWENLRAIARQADRVFLCDNSAGFQLPPLPENVRHLPFGQNLGLSAAFNRVLTDPAIPWQDDDFVLFFDQDSRIEADHIPKLVDVFTGLKAAGHPVGCLGPLIYNTSHGGIEPPAGASALAPGVSKTRHVITSSMLCTYGNLRAVDFWNEDVFLDIADWDLCWRFSAAGFLCCVTDLVILDHDLGIGEKKIGPMRLRVGHPYREYYQIRDGLRLVGKAYTPFKYRLRLLCSVFVRSPLHLLFLDNRMLRLRYICMGLRDFFRGRKGAIPN